MRRPEWKATMSIQFCCTQCGQPIEVDDEHAEKSAVCPYCRHMVAVPVGSTYRPETAVTARPVDAARETAAEPLSASAAGAPPLGGRPAILPPPRLRAAYTFGSYALVCTGLGLILFVSAMIVVQRLLPKLGTLPAAGQKPEDLENYFRAAGAQIPPWLVTLEFGSMLFMLAGLALGIVSLTQARTNWRGLTAVIVNLNRRYKGHAGVRITGLP